MGVETDGLTVPVIMSGKSGLHVVECGTVIYGGATVGFIPESRGFSYQSMISRSPMSLQPRIHQMGSSSTPPVEEGIHRNLPEPWKFGFALANTRHRQTVVSEAIVQSVRPKSIRIFLSDGDRSRCRRVVGELSLMQEFQGVGGEVEVRGTETLYRCEWDTSESVEGNDISVDLLSWRCSDVGHSIT